VTETTKTETTRTATASAQAVTDGAATARILTADTLHAQATTGPDAVRPRSFDGVSVLDGHLHLRVPAHAFLTISLPPG